MIWGPEEILMARMFNRKDFDEALAVGIDDGDWDSEELRQIWHAMLENREAGRPHDLVAIFHTTPEDQDLRNNVLLELATADPYLRLPATNVRWHIEQTFRGKHVAL